MPDFGNWTDVVESPLGFAAFVLLLVYLLVQSRKADTAYRRVFLGLAIVTVLAGLGLYYLQVPQTDAPQVVEQPHAGDAVGVAGESDPAAKAEPSGGEDQKPGQVIIQETKGGPAVAGVKGDVEINVNQPAKEDK